MANPFMDIFSGALGEANTQRINNQQLMQALQQLVFKSKLEQMVANQNPLTQLIEKAKAAEAAKTLGDENLYNSLRGISGGGAPSFSGVGDSQGAVPQNPMMQIQQLLNKGLPGGLSLTGSMPSATMPRPQAQTNPMGDYQYVPSGKINEFGKPEFKIDLNPEVVSRRKGEETKQQEIIKGPAEAAVGKLALAKESLKSIADVKKIIFPDGTPASFKRTTAFASNLPGGSLPMFPQRAWGEAEQEVFRKMSTALSARQLIQTGVAARPEETTRLISQFTPSAGSDPTAAFNALTQLEEFYRDYISQADPSYRLGVKKFEEKPLGQQQGVNSGFQIFNIRGKVYKIPSDKIEEFKTDMGM